MSGQFIDGPSSVNGAPPAGKRWDVWGYLLGNKSVSSPLTSADTNALIADAVRALVGGAPANADTLNELFGLIGTQGSGSGSTGVRRILLVGALGQSNMDGYGGVPSDVLDYDHPRVLAFEQSGPYARQIRLSREPYALNPQYSRPLVPGASPAAEFARQLADSHPDALVVVLPASEGGSALRPGVTQRYWDHTNTNPVTSLTQMFLAQSQQVVAALAERYPDLPVQWGALLWLQGESDAQENGGVIYRTRVLGLANYLRATLPGDATKAPWIMGGMSPDNQVSLVIGDRAQLREIDQVQQDIPAQLAYSAWAPGLIGSTTSDGIHYTNAASRLVGANLRRAYNLALLNNPPRAQVYSLLPAAMGPITLSNPAGTSIRVQVPVVTGATDYGVSYRLAGQGWRSVNAKSRDVQIDGLAPGTYTVRAAGWNATGIGPVAEDKNITVTGEIITPPPTTGGSGGLVTPGTIVVTDHFTRANGPLGNAETGQTPIIYTGDPTVLDNKVVIAGEAQNLWARVGYQSGSVKHSSGIVASPSAGNPMSPACVPLVGGKPNGDCYVMVVDGRSARFVGGQLTVLPAITTEQPPTGVVVTMTISAAANGNPVLDLDWPGRTQATMPFEDSSAEKVVGGTYAGFMLLSNTGGDDLVVKTQT